MTSTVASASRRPLARLWSTLRWTWLLVAFVAAWEILSRARPSPFIPAASAVASHLVATWFSSAPGELFTSEFFRAQAVPSLTRFASGWAVAIVLGISAGLLLGVSRRADMILKPLLRFGVSVPSTIFLPMAVVIFGITDRMNIFLIAAGAVWPILLNTRDGIRAIDPATLDAARSLRLKGRRLLVGIVLRAASPQIFAGLRVSLGIALVLMAISEMFVGINGIGFQIVYSQRTFLFLSMWTAVVLVGLLAIVFNGAFFLVERTVLSWHRRHEGGRT